MKMIILTILATGFLAIPSFSQYTGRYRIDTFFTDVLTLTNFSRLKLTSRHRNMETYRLPDYHVELNKQFFPPAGFVGLKHSIDSVDYKSRLDNMPFFKPDMHSGMPVLQPDSTVSYSILIKKLE